MDRRFGLPIDVANRIWPDDWDDPEAAADEPNDVNLSQDDVVLRNAPALPKNLTFKGSTKEESRAFMAAYNLYISQTNALTANGVRPFIMPVRLFKDSDNVSEAEWIAWFNQGYVVDPRALETLKKRIKTAVVFDMSIPDADSRIGRMLDGLAAAIRRDRQEWVIKEEYVVDPQKHIKTAVVFDMSISDADSRIGRMLDGLAAAIRRDRQEWDAIKPASLNRAVAEQMVLSRNKPLKKDVQIFPEAPKVSLRGAKQPRRRTYRQEDKASRLLKARGWSPGRGRNENQRDPGTPGGRVATVRVDTKKQDRPGLQTVVDGIVSVQASLLDSGADLSVASGGLVSALLAAGASPDITVMGPMVLRPYGTDSKPITVTKQVRLGSLEFKTASRSLLLCGLSVWADESDPNVELTLGLPVMKTLGYDEQTLLETARKQQAVWDFADQPVTTPGVAMHRALHLVELSDEFDDDEGMCCATPEVEESPGSDDGEHVHAVLMSKVDDAVAQGMDETAVDALRNLLVEFQDVFRLKFGRDPPLKVHLKPGAVPVKSGLRRHPPTHLAFLEKPVRELEAAGLVYRTTRPRWAAAPRFVPKKVPGDLRMTIDSRPINACTEPMPWLMPKLETAMGVLKDSRVYFTLG
ncbi:hypothetical protein H310_14627 [Aphanomyces invadans]|uniref:G-patch domain-containing protein n=1 Tax=Aphanomyces invadans TaxID=157072 RepID=A0A024T9E3_9STRA|nr:hypothetical protein H310_14627 [Aphanomyces invadans]ETV90624.1 hypothetical protein H310_14627 [Aphanomyces invadans]|eukprot:XP_008880745.1 hypothetical protein H310_14627 [Aphanomyces invadans]